MPEDARNLLRSERGPNRNYDLFDAPASMPSYVDGISAFLLGPAVTRIEFYQIKRIKEGEGVDGQPLENREQCLTIVLPTAAFAEFLGNTLKGLHDNQEVIVRNIGEQNQAFLGFINSLGGGGDGAPS
jgi:hypothetical protein